MSTEIIFDQQAIFCCEKLKQLDLHTSDTY